MIGEPGALRKSMQQALARLDPPERTSTGSLPDRFGDVGRVIVGNDVISLQETSRLNLSSAERMWSKDSPTRDWRLVQEAACAVPKNCRYLTDEGKPRSKS